MTLIERLEAASAFVQAMHDSAADMKAAADALIALDTPENIEGLDMGTVKALRREAKQARRVAARAVAEVADVHAALNDIARDDSVIGPMFGK